MKLCAVSLFSALFIIVAVNAERGEICKPYEGSHGKCISLSSCQVLLNMIISPNGKLTHNEAIQIIQKSNCGYELSEPLVCCPENPIGGHGNGSQGISNGNANDDAEQVVNPGGDNAHGAQPGGHSTLPVVTTTEPQQLPQSDDSLKTKPGHGSSSSTSQDDPPADATISVTNSPAETTTEVLGGGHGSGGFANSPTTTEDSKDAHPPPPPPEHADNPDAPGDNPGGTKDHNDLLPEECGRVLTFKYFRGNRTEFDDFPWITLVEYDTPEGKKFACGGALISDRYVLTAAHCVTGLYSTWKVTGVRFGEYDTTTDIDCLSEGDDSTFCVDKPVDVAVEEQIVYPGFLPLDHSRLHDIALLRLAQKVNFTEYVKPICLPTKKPTPQRYYTSGWGTTYKRNSTDLKYMSYLTLLEQKACEKQYKSETVYLSEYQFCAGSKPTETPCIGDAGGPLMGIEERGFQMKRVTAFGVLSLTHPETKTCEKNGWPGVYTKVLDYVPWILSQLRE